MNDQLVDPEGGRMFIEKPIIAVTDPEGDRMCFKFSHATPFRVGISLLHSSINI